MSGAATRRDSGHPGGTVASLRRVPWRRLTGLVVLAGMLTGCGGCGTSSTPADQVRPDYVHAVGLVESAYQRSVRPFQKVVTGSTTATGVCLDRAAVHPVVEPIAVAAKQAATRLAAIHWSSTRLAHDAIALKASLGTLVARVDASDQVGCNTKNVGLTPYFNRYITAFNAVVKADNKVRSALGLPAFVRRKVSTS